MTNDEVRMTKAKPFLTDFVILVSSFVIPAIPPKLRPRKALRMSGLG